MTNMMAAVGTGDSPDAAVRDANTRVLFLVSDAMGSAPPPFTVRSFPAIQVKDTDMWVSPVIGWRE